MMEYINLIEYCKKMEAALEYSIAKRKAFLSKCPVGTLECYRNGKQFTWYRIDRIKGEGGVRKKRTLIKKKNFVVAERLALKGYNKDALRVENAQLKAIRLLLKHFPTEAPGQRYIERNEEYMRLSASHNAIFKFTPKEWDWINCPRPIAQNWTAELTTPCVMDYMVRSKSESEYISKFVELGIVFRYEWPLELAGYVSPVFPDFTILDTNTGQLYILEHFGKMDDPEYVRRNADKIQKYVLNGWFPGRNLFISYETKDKPFTSYDAEEMLRKNFSQLIKE